jgi:hypothetical protein
MLSLTDRPLYPRSKSRLSCCIGWLEGFRTVWRLWNRENFLGPTDIQNTTVRLCSQYVSYCTDWALGGNTLSLFVDCHQCLLAAVSAVKLTAKNIIDINWMYWTVTAVFWETKTLRPFNRLRCSCTDRQTDNLRGHSKAAWDWEGRHCARYRRWVMSNWVKVDWQYVQWDLNC